MNETYPTQPTLLLSENIYALRISVFEDGDEMQFCDYDEAEQHALHECMDDLIGHSSGNFVYELDSVIGEENEWIPILVCRLQEGFRVPFPLSVLDHTVDYSNGEEKKLVGMKLRIHPRGTTYKWADKVEVLLEEYYED
jgi:hypothetical protein